MTLSPAGRFLSIFGRRLCLGNLFFAAFLLSLTALRSGAAEIAKNEGTDFAFFFKDAKETVLSPLKWGKKDFGKLGIWAAVGTGVYYLGDDNWEDYIESWQDNDLNDFAEGVKFLGDGLFVFPFFSGLYLYGSCSGNPRLASAGFMGIESYLVSGAITGFLKLAFHRARPKSGQGFERFREQRFFSKSNLSFPSGHATSAFAGARIMDWYFRGRPLPRFVFYGLASAVAWARVNNNEHWPSDVFAGALIGYYTAGRIIALNEKRKGFSFALLPFYRAGGAAGAGFIAGF